MVGIDVIPGGSDTNSGVAMWTPTTRKQHIRNTNRYQTEMTDEEWRVIEPHLSVARAQDDHVHGRCARSSTASSM